MKSLQLVAPLLWILVSLPALGQFLEVPGWLGLGYRYHESNTPQGEPTGWLLVHGVAPGGPAESAGLRANDVIVEIDDESFRYETDLELLNRFAKIEPNQEVVFRVKRGTDELNISVKAVTMPPQLREVWLRNYELARQSATRKHGS